MHVDDIPSQKPELKKEETKKKKHVIAFVHSVDRITVGTPK